MHAVPKKIRPKVKDPYIQQMLEHVAEHPNPTATAQLIAQGDGVNVEILLRNHIPTQTDCGLRRGVSSEEPQKVKDLKAKVRWLGERSDTLRRASIFLAGELDPQAQWPSRSSSSAATGGQTVRVGLPGPEAVGLPDRPRGLPSLGRLPTAFHRSHGLGLAKVSGQSLGFISSVG